MYYVFCIMYYIYYVLYKCVCVCVCVKMFTFPKIFNRIYLVILQYFPFIVKKLVFKIYIKEYQYIHRSNIDKEIY